MFFKRLFSRESAAPTQPPAAPAPTDCYVDVVRHRKTGQVHFVDYKKSADHPGGLTLHGSPVPVPAQEFSTRGLDLVLQHLASFASRPAGPGERPGDEYMKLVRSRSQAWVTITRHPGNPQRLSLLAMYYKSSGAGMSSGEPISLDLPCENSAFQDALERAFRQSGVRPARF